jgi:hypothetical protein
LATLSVVVGMVLVLSVEALRRVYPHRNRCKRSLPICAVAAVALVVAGCGGGGGAAGNQSQAGGGSGQAVAGAGFSFRTPDDWKVTVRPTSAEAKGVSSELVSVTVLPLLKPYRLALFPRVVTELDRVASTLATRLGGEVTSSQTVTIAGRQARQYEIEHGGLVDRITFVLRGKRNFQLACRWRADDGEPDACGQLSSSFAFR